MSTCFSTKIAKLNYSIPYSYHRPGFSVNGAFLKNIAKFDNVEFGIGIKDAKSMLMSTRRLLELSFLAALDSGTQYRGRSFGSFMCGTGTEHFDEVCYV